MLQHRHADLAMRFATRGAPKFDGAGFQPDADGLPFLTEDKPGGARPRASAIFPEVIELDLGWM